jgi:hypothetical protein
LQSRINEGGDRSTAAQERASGGRNRGLRERERESRVFELHGGGKTAVTLCLLCEGKVEERK